MDAMARGASDKEVMLPHPHDALACDFSFCHNLSHLWDRTAVSIRARTASGEGNSTTRGPTQCVQVCSPPSFGMEGERQAGRFAQDVCHGMRAPEGGDRNGEDRHRG
jgi:hypothetical protein